MTIETDDHDPHGDETVWLGNKAVGNTTSGCYSYHLGKSLAFAYVPPLLSVPGTEVQVELLGEMHTATVLAGPPVLTHTARAKK